MIVRAPLASKALEHLGEAGTPADRVRAADRRVVELVDDLVTRRLGVGVDCGALPLVAVLVRAGVGERACAQIGDSFRDVLGHVVKFSP